MAWTTNHQPKYDTVPDDPRAAADYYRLEVRRAYRQSAKARRDAAEYRSWARARLAQARLAHRWGDHGGEASQLSLARLFARLARQQDRRIPKRQAWARQCAAWSRERTRQADERDARVAAWKATPEGQAAVARWAGGVLPEGTEVAHMGRSGSHGVVEHRHGEWADVRWDDQARPEQVAITDLYEPGSNPLAEKETP